MKKPKHQSPVWPYLGILACLFLLSVTAPRAWDRSARREPIPSRARERFVRPKPPIVDRVALEVADEAELAPRASEPDTMPASEATQADVLTADRPFVPPAPEFAQEVREEIDVAHLPALPERRVPDLDVLELNVPELELDDPEASVPYAESNPDAEYAVAQPESVWPLPRGLLEQLTDLTHDDPQLIWAQRAIQLIDELCRHADDAVATGRTLEDLRTIVTHDALVPGSDPSMEAPIIRSRYALRRWVDVWEAAAELEAVPPAERVDPASNERIADCLDRFEKLARRAPAGAAWREYLRLDALAEAMSPGVDDLARRSAARAVLDRLSARQLTQAQRRFAQEGPLAELRQELQTWAAEPVAIRQILSHLDEYEYSGLASDAELVAADWRSLRWSAAGEAHALGQQLDTHYRNANVRVAMAGRLINRLVPQPERIVTPVRDRVMNVPVRGSSSTFTRISVQLVPDPRRIRLGLEARGTVDSNTISSSGPATFRNAGQSTFLVRKLFLLGPQGLKVWPAIAEAESNYNYLVSLETDFDGVPLVGSLVKTIARGQYDEARAEARRQTEQKVAIKALHHLDSEVQVRLVEAGKKLEDNQGATLRRLDLELAPISFSTTEQRVVARARLSGHEQLGAHTPRPRAPSDSWFSLQMHQSALNNGLAQLDLEGRTFQLPELFAWIAEKLGRPELAEQDDLPDGVQLTFADRDAVLLRCRDGRVEVTFALAELKHDASRWRDFQVRAYYVPEIEGRLPAFTRDPDDVIRLDGESLKGKIAPKLRAIFARVLSKNRDVRLLDASITGDPRLADLQVTQFAIDDGWIGLAYSPRRASNVARRRE